MIREATIFDNLKINRLGKIVNENYEKLFKLDEILNEKYTKMYVYEIDDNIVGFIHATVLYETIDIINIAVDPNYRRKKVASNLFDYLLTEAPSQVGLITLEVNENNIAAINFYKSFGLEIISRRKGYYKNDDAYLMGRSIEK